MPTTVRFVHHTWHDERVNNQLPRVRRPVDLARLFLAVGIGALIFTAGNLAAQATSGLQSDIVQATRLLPTILIVLITAIGGTFAVLLPAAYLVSAVFERKFRLILEAHIAALITIVIAIAGNNLIASTNTPALYAVFVGRYQIESAAPLNTLLAATLAIAVVLRLTERRIWSIVTIVVTAILGWSTVLAGSATLISQVLSAIGGISVGLIIRLVLGTPSTRPNLDEVISELSEYDLTTADLMEISPNTYLATLKSGKTVRLEILDRDADRSGFISAFWRTLRVRGIESGAGLSMRTKAERLMLANLAARNAGIAAAELFAIKEVTADAIVILREEISTVEITNETAELNKILEEVWQQLAKLHQSDIAHRQATLNSFGIHNGKVIVKNLDFAVVAASKLLMALDIAELLLATTHLVGASKAVEIANRHYPTNKIFFAGRLLQPIAMSSTSRANLKSNQSSLAELRTALGNLGFEPDGKVINIERLKPRNILLLVVSVAAGYAVLNQLAEVNLIEIFTAANTSWVLVALVFSAITYFGATLSLTAFVVYKVNWLHALLAQLAAKFITLVTPPAVGAVSVNIRFLQRTGLSPGIAGAAVAMSQVAMFATHLVMILLVSVIAGTSNELRFDPPRWVLLTIFSVILLLFMAFSFPPTRNWLNQITFNLRNQTSAAILKSLTQPRRFAMSVLGSLLMNLAYILCLAATIRAFGNNTDLITVAFIYLAGATLGSLAPTPGGLGAVEAVLVAALTAGGLPAATAISVTLLYRLVTFWLPILPGWIGFNYLTRRQAL
jgi:uncharacterized protein (TIRG00374 family)